MLNDKFRPFKKFIEGHYLRIMRIPSEHLERAASVEVSELISVTYDQDAFWLNGEDALRC
jgi:hypothetical protein